MEKDNNGSNVPAFDCCFSTDVIPLYMQNKKFKELLVETAIDGIEAGYKKQGQENVKIIIIIIIITFKLFIYMYMCILKM